MSNVVSLSVTKRKKLKAKKRQGKTLCANNLHQWVVDKTSEFDSQQGRLVTRYQCKHCGKTKVKGEGKS
ncbi:hypothetical protein [Pleionea litopenaei]|uniref:Uncharacterized protein n=1 Tax=Pleionea litopenaei TaxID=3070815 RepID=A0AA51RRP3_9GAMM|nr:hypothetical protein [Pleionea sp. HL-JVS1]WMS86356.1 hypothetical protein Q9312_14120 [Pleionea sp. HL-JVS1]